MQQNRGRTTHYRENNIDVLMVVHARYLPRPVARFDHCIGAGTRVGIHLAGIRLCQRKLTHDLVLFEPAPQQLQWLPAQMRRTPNVSADLAL